MEGNEEEEFRLFLVVPSDRTNVSGHKYVQKIPFRHKKSFFTMRVLEHWHTLVREDVQSSSLEIFKTQEKPLVTTFS